MKYSVADSDIKIQQGRASVSRPYLCILAVCSGVQIGGGRPRSLGFAYSTTSRPGSIYLHHSLPSDFGTSPSRDQSTESHPLRPRSAPTRNHALSHSFIGGRFSTQRSAVRQIQLDLSKPSNPRGPGAGTLLLPNGLTAHVIKLLHSRCGKFPSSNFLLCLRSSVLSDSQALHIWLERAVG
jgi:hypothetical protein